MYKTIWVIHDLTTDTNTELVYYHFGKEPFFPSWYMEEKHAYEIEVLWNVKLLNTVSIFFKCLTHYYIIR